MAQAPGLSAALGARRQAYEEALRQLDESSFERRLLGKDPSQWEGDQEAIAARLGWLDLPRRMQDSLPELRAFAEAVREAGFERVVLLGMGGSSLAPEVMSGAFGAAPGYPSLLLLDTTDPATIAAAERSLRLEKTLFIVSSKSGTTVETSSLYRYFAARLPPNGENGARDNFIAITDPGTPLERLGKTEGFRRVFVNHRDVGGRFSALSFFGLVPAAAIGIDAGRLLDSAESLDIRGGVELGAALGGLALAGQDKVTFLASPSLRGFGAWAEQLLAESTGKLGKGIIPVDGEPLGTPEVYGDDRLFVYLRLDGEPGPDERLGALEAAGHPVITIALANRYGLGGEFLRWEIATAAAGALLGINPFDEPNVAEAKERTEEVLHDPELVAQTERFSLEVELDYLEELGVRRGGYWAILAFIPRTPDHDDLLTRLRIVLRDNTKAATSVGYGPRYLHSTGQLFKGGPKNGVFWQIVSDDVIDLEIPGQVFTFSALKRAQALGDLFALQSRGRQVRRLDLSAEGGDGLKSIVSALEARRPSTAPAGGA